MIKKVLAQIGYLITVLFGVITLVFFLFNVLPGDPAQMMVGQRSNAKTIQNIRVEYGFNQPLYKQYLVYLNDLSPVSFVNKNSVGFGFSSNRYKRYRTIMRFNSGVSVILKMPYLRKSYQSKQDVSELIRDTLPNSLILAFVSIVIAAILGIVLGIIVAYHKNTLIDKAIVSLSAFGMSLPSFFAAIIIGWIFAFLLHKYTGLNLTGSIMEVDSYGMGEKLALQNMILPVITLAIRPLSVFVQLTRNSLLDEMSSDYFLTAKAKGLSTISAIKKHALKNALNPLITTISGWFASMIAGVVFVEYIFGWKGIGYLMVQSLNNYDFPVLMGCILVIAFLFLIINILVDIAYRILDPRIH